MSPPPPPDPARGLFETMLVAAGRPVELGVHLDRIGGSLRELFGAELPAGLEADVLAAARPLELGRMRIDVVPDPPRGEPTYSIEAKAIDPAIFFPDREHGAELSSVVARDWAGSHKWADRSWLESLESELGEVVPLIVAEDGTVLEAGRANVFLATGESIATPPTDQRILPGTARAATLALAAELGIAAAERSLSLDDLRGADGVFLTSSIRGIRPVRSLDGTELEHRGTLVERLAQALRRRWLSE